MVSITLKQFFKWHKYINFKIESAEIWILTIWNMFLLC
jgi:hypothetical protein